MQLMIDEEVLSPAANGFPILTTHRLWRQTSGGGKREVRTMLLEDLCSCVVRHEENSVWLGSTVLAVVAAVVLATANQRQAAPFLVGGGAVAVMCWLLYRGSKRQLLHFRSASDRVAVELRGDVFEQAVAFVEAVLAAKDARYMVGKVSEGKARAASA